MFMFICLALAVIQLLHVSPESHNIFQSLTTPVFTACPHCSQCRALY